MQSLYEILMLILGIARFFVFAHFIMSWLINFQVLNIRQPLVAQIWYGLNRLLEPIYGPIRRILPDMGGIDLSPIVALIGIYALEIILRNNIGAFVYVSRAATGAAQPLTDYRESWPRTALAGPWSLRGGVPCASLIVTMR